MLDIDGADEPFRFDGDVRVVEQIDVGWMRDPDESISLDCDVEVDG